MTDESNGESDTRISIDNVGKKYGDLHVFQDINLIFKEREIVTVVGPSGCGKTTLLRCIDGLIPVTDGEIRVDGDLITEPKEGVSMVFQHFGLFPYRRKAGKPYPCNASSASF